MVSSHCGSVGHHGKVKTNSIIKEDFIWKEIDQFVDECVNGCLYFMIKISGQKVSCTSRTALHGGPVKLYIYELYEHKYKQRAREVSFDDKGLSVWVCMALPSLRRNYQRRFSAAFNLDVGTWSNEMVGVRLSLSF